MEYYKLFLRTKWKCKSGTEKYRTAWVGMKQYIVGEDRSRKYEENTDFSGRE
jgi:hypothetical protein